MENYSKREKGKMVREEEIVTAAEKVFGLKGFDDASMNEIAKEAQTTKRTLYFYFDNKEDLYFTVILKGYRKLFSYWTAANTDGLPGYEKIRETCKYLLEFYSSNPEFFWMISFIGHVRKRATGTSKRQIELLQFNDKMFQSYADLIAEGIEDGSVQSGLDAQKTAFSLVFLITSFFNQLSSTGNTFTQHFKMNIDDFSHYVIDLLLGTLKGNMDDKQEGR